jgi:hypothetical protein
MGGQFRVAGNIRGCGDDGLPGYRVEVGVAFSFELPDPSFWSDPLPQPKPPHAIHRKHVSAGVTTTDEAGVFELSFDFEALKQQAGVPSTQPTSGPMVRLLIFEPGGTAQVHVTGFLQPLFGEFSFQLRLPSVTVVSWQLHVPSGAARLSVGDVAVLTALVRNNLRRQISGLVCGSRSARSVSTTISPPPSVRRRRRSPSG